jgi:cystathionine beta-lyase
MVFQFASEVLPGIRMNLPEATFLAWLDCRALNLETEPSEFFLKEARVAMNAGSWFGANGTGYVRLNFGCPQSVLEEALERMRLALKKAE